MAIFVALSVTAIIWFITEKQPLGEIYMSSVEAAMLLVFRNHVKQHALAVHIISGLCAGIAGAVLTASRCRTYGSIVMKRKPLRLRLLVEQASLAERVEFRVIIGSLFWD